ncbi:hypothetical protein [Desulfocurvus sp. DL9XJH121]
MINLPVFIQYFAAVAVKAMGSVEAVKSTVWVADTRGIKSFFVGYLMELYNTNRLLLALWVVVLVGLCALALGSLLRLTTRGRGEERSLFKLKPPSPDDEDEDKAGTEP